MKTPQEMKSLSRLGSCRRFSSAAGHKRALTGVERNSAAGTRLARLYNNGADMSSFKACLEHMGITEMLFTAKTVIGAIILTPVGSAPIHTKSILTCHCVSRRIRHARLHPLCHQGRYPSSVYFLVNRNSSLHCVEGDTQCQCQLLYVLAGYSRT
jgi:hypothetical protein